MLSLALLLKEVDMAAKSVSALLREKDQIKKSGMRPDLVDRLCADIDRQIEELAAQLPLPLKTGDASKSKT